MTKTKIGVIGGLGSIGKRHVKNLQELDCEVAVSDLGSSHTDLASCDGIVVASPTSTHLDYLSWCMFHRKPALVEKPLGDDLLHAELVASVAKEHKLPLYVGFNLRFHACVAEAKKRMASLGKVQWAHFMVAQRNSRPDYLRDGVLLNWLSHEIDLALYLLGPARILTVAGDDRCMVDMVLLHDSGAQTALHGDYVTEPEHREFTVVGTEGCFKYELTDHDFDQDYRDEMRAFLTVVNGGGNGTLATAVEGLDGLRICLAAREMLS